MVVKMMMNARKPLCPKAESSRCRCGCQNPGISIKGREVEVRSGKVYLPQPEQEQLPEEQVQELEEPEQPQSPFILMVWCLVGV
jgi:hypothetical protein